MIDMMERTGRVFLTTDNCYRTWRERGKERERVIQRQPSGKLLSAHTKERYYPNITAAILIKIACRINR